MMIHKIPLIRIQFVVWMLNLMNQAINIQQKSPKLLSQQIRKRYYIRIGTGVITTQFLLPKHIKTYTQIKRQ